MRKPEPNPSPQKLRVYTGPPTPIAYDDNWQFFTNLTSDQVAWFQAQPEWVNYLAYVALSPNTAQAGAPASVVSSTLSSQPMTSTKALNAGAK